MGPPRFLQLFYNGSGERVLPGDGKLLILRDVLRDNQTAPSALSTIRRKAEAFIAHCKGMHVEMFAMTSPWDSAAYVRAQYNVSKSGPMKSWRAILWCERVFACNMFASDKLVDSQKVSGKKDSVAHNLPEPAECATVKMLIHMEELTCNAQTIPLCCNAGFQASLGHNVIRATDQQRSMRVMLTEDAIMAVSWGMKGKKHLEPWAVLRHGFSKKDWGATWLEKLGTAGLPGEDFLLLRSTYDYAAFVNKVATWSDLYNGLMVLLTLGGWMTVEQALRYSLHSWRHLYNTMARQLNLKRDDINTMSHWSLNSRMSEVYDSAACVSELRTKSVVRNAVWQGWEMVSPGNVPKSVPMSSTEEQSKTVELRKVSNRVKIIPQKVQLTGRQVVHFQRGKVHIHIGGIFTLCGNWKCGSPTEAADTATFYDTLDNILDGQDGLSFCKACYGNRLASYLQLPMPQQEEPVSVSKLKIKESSSDESHEAAPDILTDNET